MKNKEEFLSYIVGIRCYIWMMIQNGAEKAEVWNISVLSVVTALMAFFYSRNKWLYGLVQFLKVGVTHSKCFK